MFLDDFVFPRKITGYVGKAAYSSSFFGIFLAFLSGNSTNLNSIFECGTFIEF
jgi:hypothetical protein